MDSTETARTTLHETLDLIDSECKRLNITRAEFMGRAGLTRDLATMWLRLEAKGKITTISEYTVAKIHKLINDAKPPVQTVKHYNTGGIRPGKHPGNNATMEETKKNIDFVKKACRELDMSVAELERAALGGRKVVSQWIYNFNQGHPTWFRGSSLEKLKAKIKELKKAKDEAALEAMKQQREAPTTKYEPPAVTITKADIMAKSEWADQQASHVMRALTAEDLGFDDTSVRIGVSSARPTACQALKQHIRERLESFTLVQLAQLIAHIDGVK